MSRDVVLGLDLGTSGLKAVAVGSDGAVAGSAVARYATARPGPGAAEQDTADWHAAAARCVHEIAGRLDVRVAAIGLSGMLPTLVLAGEDGVPVGPAITWEDARAESDAAALIGRLGIEQIYAATGQRVDGRYLLPMYLRIVRTDPERAAAAPRLLGAKDHLFEWLTGERATDPSTAAGYGCYNLHTSAWLDTMLDLCPRRPVLPPVAPSCSTAPLSAEAAQRLGLAARIPVTVGAADSVLGAAAIGVDAPGAAACLAGTSTVIIGVDDRLIVDSQMRYLITPMADIGGAPLWGMEMDLLSTGSATAWLSDLTGLDPADLTAGAEGRDLRAAPVLLPYLAPGEQGALWAPQLAGTLFGLTLSHTRADLARALRTGTVLEIRRCLDVLADVTGNAGPLRIAGAGAPDPAELAAATGRRISTAAPEHSSAFGAALLAGAPHPPAHADPPAPPPTADDVRLWHALAQRHDDALAASLAYHVNHPALPEGRTP